MSQDTKACERCGAVMDRNELGRSKAEFATRRYCSFACQNPGKRAPARKPPQTKNCEQCNATIVRGKISTKDWNAKRFCSVQCRHDFQRVVMYKDCVRCGRTFVRTYETPSNFTRRKFCTEACRRHDTAYYREEAVWLLEGGEWPPRIAQRLGITCEYLYQLFQRVDIDTARRFHPFIREEQEANAA